MLDPHSKSAIIKLIYIAINEKNKIYCKIES